MADYAIVIKACSKIVCHALSRIKTKAMLSLLPNLSLVESLKAQP